MAINNDNNPFFKKDQEGSGSKYVKYSTEQLEAILPHVDKEDKEQVKEELTKRYYDYYIQVAENRVGQIPDTAGQNRDQTIAAETGQSADAGAPVISDKEEDAKLEPESIEGSQAPDETIEETGEVNKIAKPVASTGGEEKRKYCFIATAAYGSPLAEEVVLLKYYRDAYLSSNPLGRKFIQGYYLYSPYWANRISKNTMVKSLIRALLRPIIYFLKKFSTSTPKA